MIPGLHQASTFTSPRGRPTHIKTYPSALSLASSPSSVSICTSPSSNLVTQVPQRPWRQPLGIPTPCISATSSRVLPGGTPHTVPERTNSIVLCNGDAASTTALPPGGAYPKLSRLMHSERTARDPSIPCTLSMNGGGPQRQMVAEHKPSTWVAIKSRLTRPRGPFHPGSGCDKTKTIRNSW